MAGVDEVVREGLVHVVMDGLSEGIYNSIVLTSKKTEKAAKNRRCGEIEKGGVTHMFTV